MSCTGRSGWDVFSITGVNLSSSVAVNGFEPALSERGSMVKSVFRKVMRESKRDEDIIATKRLQLKSGRYNY